MRVFMRVHLVDGTSVDSDSAELDMAEFEHDKGIVAELIKSSAGWQINFDMANGNWSAFPKQSILYVEYVVEKDDA